MKIVISKSSTSVTLVADVKMTNIYALSVPSGKLCILHRLGCRYVANKYGFYHYGFVNLSKPNTAPTFRHDDPQGSVQLAINRGHKVMEFENLTELLSWKFKCK